jgi:hypothetical protein
MKNITEIRGKRTWGSRISRSGLNTKKEKKISPSSKPHRNKRRNGKIKK